MMGWTAGNGGGTVKMDDTERWQQARHHCRVGLLVL